jgi:hypothetical protein
MTCTNCGTPRLAEARCKKRWCPVCARAISAKRVAKYVGAVESMQWPLFLTLTRPNLDVLHLQHIKEMRSAFRRMRQRVWWPRCVKGGIASIEITNIGNGWHPHIHAIIDCRWLSVTTPAPRPFDSRAMIKNKCEKAARETAAAWAAAMRLPECRIHVKRAYTERTTPEMPRNNQSIAIEVLKYSVKPGDLINCKEPIGDLIRLMGAARLVSSWGSCYGKNLVDEEEQPYAGAMCECGCTGTFLPDMVIDRMIGRPRNYLK